MNLQTINFKSSTSCETEKHSCRKYTDEKIQKLSLDIAELKNQQTYSNWKKIIIITVCLIIFSSYTGFLCLFNEKDLTDVITNKFFSFVFCITLFLFSTLFLILFTNQNILLILTGLAGFLFLNFILIIFLAIEKSNMGKFYNLVYGLIKKYLNNPENKFEFCNTKLSLLNCFTALSVFIAFFIFLLLVSIIEMYKYLAGIALFIFVLLIIIKNINITKLSGRGIG